MKGSALDVLVEDGPLAANVGANVVIERRESLGRTLIFDCLEEALDLLAESSADIGQPERRKIPPQARQVHDLPVDLSFAHEDRANSLGSHVPTQSLARMSRAAWCSRPLIRQV